MTTSTAHRRHTANATLARLTHSALIALILLCAIWEVFFPLTGTAGVSWLMLKGCFLLPLLRGIRGEQKRAYQILSLLILAYFTEGVMRAWSDPHLISRGFAVLELILSCGLFYTANTMAYRLKKTQALEANTDHTHQSPPPNTHKKPRPNARVQLVMYLYATLLLLSWMLLGFPTDGTESALFIRTRAALLGAFILLNILLITRWWMRAKRLKQQKKQEQ